MQAGGFCNITEKCFQGTSPPCACQCPLNVDVKALMDKAQKGNFTTAYRLYRNQVLFPRIVSLLCDQPCRDNCIGSRDGTAINIQYLERACIAYTRDREPTNYNVPKKDFRIAIVGAGLSGMACALRLAARNYDVTVYEKRPAVGGRLSGLLPAEIYSKEFEDEFANVSYTLKLSTAISDFSEIAADAVFVATGAQGNDFGLRDGMNLDSLGTEKPGVFLGGSLLGTTPCQSIEHGSRASHSIEKYLKTGLMDGIPETYEQRGTDQDYPFLSVPPGEPLAESTVDREKAIAEAKRCQKCDCAQCVNNCDLMQAFRKNPHRIEVDVNATLSSIEGFSKRVASRLINSCNQCGLCGIECPEDIDMGDYLLDARKQLFKEGAIPPAYHDYWLRDMEFANSDVASALIPSDARSEYLFFPGCQLGASNPDNVRSAYDFLNEVYGGVSIHVGCCGVPADWAGDEELRDKVHADIRKAWHEAGQPIVIAACPTCLKTFARYIPEMQTVSLYEVMFQNTRPAWNDIGKGDTVSVFDPCASRYDQAMQGSIRGLLQQAGYALEELDHHGEQAQCCSFGGQIHAANPGHVGKITQNRIGQSPHPYVVYCTNCRDTFAAAGKACAHVLDLFFGSGFAAGSPVNLSQRRHNRAALVRMLSGGTAEGCEQEMEKIRLSISPELQKKMDEKLILRENALAVIAYCQSTGSAIQNSDTGAYIGHLTQGAFTYWAVYIQEESGYTLQNVYAHRMAIQEEAR